jgi:hypothetical protein
MTAARAKAPTLAWLLTALTSLLVGMAIVESRHQAVAVPVWAPGDAVETVEVGAIPSASAGSTPTPIRIQEEPLPTSRVGDISVPLETGAVILRVTRLVVPPSVNLVPEVASGWTVVLVETGTLSVRVDGAVFVGQGLDPAQVDGTLSAGERLVIPPGARYAVHNDGLAVVQALTVTLVSSDSSAPRQSGPGGG